MSKSSFTIFEKWVMSRCPAEYVLSFSDGFTVPLELKTYITKFMMMHEPSFEAYDAALAGFEMKVPVKKASFDFEPKAIPEQKITRQPFDRRRCGAVSLVDAIVDDDSPAPSIADGKCAECGIPLRPEQARFVFGSQKAHRCDCCESMIESSSRQPGLVRAQAEYEQENFRKIQMLKS